MIRRVFSIESEPMGPITKINAQNRGQRQSSRTIRGSRAVARFALFGGYTSVVMRSSTLLSESERRTRMIACTRASSAALRPESRSAPFVKAWNPVPKSSAMTLPAFARNSSRGRGTATQIRRGRKGRLTNEAAPAEGAAFVIFVASTVRPPRCAWERDHRRRRATDQKPRRELAQSRNEARDCRREWIVAISGDHVSGVSDIRELGVRNQRKELLHAAHAQQVTTSPSNE